MIIIEGVSGVGKTTLQQKLCQRIINSYMLIQDFEHNICLKDFYEGDSCLLQKQMIFLFSDYHVLRTTLNKHPEKIMISDFSLERSAIMAKEYLSEYEYKRLFIPCYSYLMERCHIQHKMLVLLYASPEQIKENIETRHRSMEQGIQLQIIQHKQQLLIEELTKCNFEEVIKVNCDFVNILDEGFIGQLTEKVLRFEKRI